MRTETVILELRGPQTRLAAFCGGLSRSLEDGGDESRPKQVAAHRVAVARALQTRQEDGNAVRLTLESSDSELLVERMMAAAQLWGLETAVAAAPKSVVGNGSERMVAEIKFKAVRPKTRAGQWTVRCPNGMELVPGHWGVDGASRNALWSSLEDLHARYGTEAFRREFGDPRTRLPGELTVAQLGALRRFVAEHGPSWKSALTALWTMGEGRARAAIPGVDVDLLRQIRNRYGIGWVQQINVASVEAVEHPAVTSYEESCREQRRYDAAHHRADTLDTPAARAAQDTFADGDLSIEGYEEALYEEEMRLAHKPDISSPRP